MSVAPFSINGGSVESGGVASAFGRASRRARGACGGAAAGRGPFCDGGRDRLGCARAARLLHAAAACRAHHLHTEPRACGPLHRNLHQWSRAHPPPRPRRRRATPGARGPDDADDDADDADAAAGGGCAG
eukprot:114811-Prymnesium_polylepis.1